jgi:hypothetical protein
MIVKGIVGRRVAFVAAAAGSALLLGACSDSSEVVTFTDEHGRVCTATVIVDTDGDREVSALDCEYPPAGRTPGASVYRKLPDRP